MTERIAHPFTYAPVGAVSLHQLRVLLADACRLVTWPRMFMDERRVLLDADGRRVCFPRTICPDGTSIVHPDWTEVASCSPL